MNANCRSYPFKPYVDWEIVYEVDLQERSSPVKDLLESRLSLRSSNETIKPSKTAQ